MEVGNFRVGQLIRATHPYGYRYGWTDPWGLIIGAGWYPTLERFVYLIQYKDGVLDVWPQVDSLDPYEFCLPDELNNGSLTATEDIPSSIPQQEK